MVKRYDCDVCYDVGMTPHASGDWVSYSDYAVLLKEPESKIALLEVQLKLSEAAERAWESSMMQACGEDGPKSVADKFAELQAKCAELAAENGGLKKSVEFATAPDMWIEQADGMLDYRYCEWYVDVLKAAMETTATDAFLAEVLAHDLNAFIRHHSAELDAHIKNGGELFDEKSVRIRDIIVSARLFREQIRKEVAQ